MKTEQKREKRMRVGEGKAEWWRMATAVGKTKMKRERRDRSGFAPVNGTEECTRQVVKLICTTSYTFYTFQVPILAKKKKKTKSLIPMGIFSGPQTLREMFPNAPLGPKHNRCGSASLGEPALEHYQWCQWLYPSFLFHCTKFEMVYKHISP